MKAETKLHAEFNQSRNDMRWQVFDLKDGFVRWTGYDDAYWWDHVSKSHDARKRVGKVTGHIYEIDFDTGDVFVTQHAADALLAQREEKL